MRYVYKDAKIAVFGALSIAVRADSSSLQQAASIHNFISVPIRSAGLLSKCGDNCRFPQSERAEDPQQFPGVQFSNGWYGHLHERHRRRVLQLPEVSDVTTLFHKAQSPVWLYETQHSAQVSNRQAAVGYNRCRSEPSVKDRTINTLLNLMSTDGGDGSSCWRVISFMEPWTEIRFYFQHFQFHRS